MKSLPFLPVILVACALVGASCSSRPGQSHTMQAAGMTGVGRREAAASRHADAKGGEVLKAMRCRPSEELTLPSDMDIPPLGSLARAWAARSETIVYERTQRDGVAARMAIREIHGRNQDTVYVFIAGLFSDSLTWKYVVAANQSEQAIWAMDLIGTGLSDCPDPDQVGPGGYSPEALAERALQALQARLEAHPEVSHLIIAGHSLGGMVTLRMFMDDSLQRRYPGVLAKVQGLALFAPSDVLVTQPTESWKSFFGINSLKAGVGDALRILQYQVVQALRESFCDPQLASREVADYSIRVVREAPYRRATQATMREAVPWRVFIEHADFEAGELLEAGYAKVTVPCLVVWGKRDESLSAALGHKIKDQLPDARLVLIPQTKHLLTLERPQVCAELVRQFHRQMSNGELSAAHSVRTFDLSGYQDHLLAGPGGTSRTVTR